MQWWAAVDARLHEYRLLLARNQGRRQQAQTQLSLLKCAAQTLDMEKGLLDLVAPLQEKLEGIQTATLPDLHVWHGMRSQHH